MRTAAAAAAACCAAARAEPPTMWQHAPLGPLGVPGYPHCVSTRPVNMTPPATGAELLRRERALRCSARPRRAGQTAVACVGDSITEGHCATSEAATYPDQLQEQLGSGYVVTNYGASGSTMQKTADSPYWERPQYAAAMGSNADIVVIMLGTNDAKDTGDGGPANWQNDGHTGAARFKADYKVMIDQFKAFESKPVIYTAIPPPLYQPRVYGMNQSVINDVFPRLIAEINAENGLPHPPIDAFTALGGPGLTHPDWSCDGCHPTDAGYVQLAAAVRRAVAPGLPTRAPTPAPPTPPPTPARGRGVWLYEQQRPMKGDGKVFIPAGNFTANPDRGGALAWNACNAVGDGCATFDDGHPPWSPLGSNVGSYSVVGDWALRGAGPCWGAKDTDLGPRTTAADGVRPAQSIAYLEAA